MFERNEITYYCSNPNCETPHTAEIVSELPTQSMDWETVERLPRQFDEVEAAIPGLSRGTASKSRTAANGRESHCEIMAVASDQTALLLRWIPKRGWSVYKESRLLGAISSEDYCLALLNDYYQ